MSENWLSTSLGEIASWGAGGTPKAGDPRFYEGGTIPWAVISDIQDAPISDTEKHLTAAGADQIGHLAPAESVLVTMYGTVGRIAITTREMATNQAIAWAIPDRSRVTPEFLFQWLRAHRDEIDSLARGATQRNINRAILRNLSIELPPLDVQKRIVDLLGAFDLQAVALAAEFDSARALMRRRRADALSRGDLIPAVAAFSILMGRQRSPGRATGPNMTRYLRAANIKDGRLELADVKEMDFDEAERDRFGLKPGDVLVSEGSGSPTAVGAAARWNGELPEPVCLQNTLLRYRAIEGVTCPSFVYHWCRWAYESGAFRGVATGTNILHIGASRAESMPVAIVPVAEQIETCLELDSLERVTEALALEITALTVLRSRLSASLQTGEVALSDGYDSLLEGVA